MPVQLPLILSAKFLPTHRDTIDDIIRDIVLAQVQKSVHCECPTSHGSGAQRSTLRCLCMDQHDGDRVRRETQLPVAWSVGSGVALTPAAHPTRHVWCARMR